MRLRQYIVDAFVRGPFSGNPAAVVPLESWLDDALMQSIAAENNLSETAFFVPALDVSDQGRRARSYDLRWFTPATEVDLCGHATLATAHVLTRELEEVEDGGWIAFETRSGRLNVDVGLSEYAMALPAVVPRPVEAGSKAATVDAGAVLSALGAGDGTVLGALSDLLVAYPDRGVVESCHPDFSMLAELGVRAVCITADANSDEYDFVTRVFAPGVGIDEDPATGSAQCALGPYWVERLERSPVHCEQLSRRGAALTTHWQSGEGHVTVIGRCSTFSRGEITVAH